jgi:hypothetical protein
MDAKATAGSGHGVNGSQRRSPVAVYGYFDRVTSGLAMCSEHAHAHHPLSSAARAIGRYDAGSIHVAA